MQMQTLGEMDQLLKAMVVAELDRMEDRTVMAVQEMVVLALRTVAHLVAPIQEIVVPVLADRTKAPLLEVL